jgi:Ca2+:H+ antiporter
VESPAIEASLRWLGFPQSFVGVILAIMVLLPESIAAVRAASQNRTQIALNLGYGSAMASIGLTIPTLAVVSIWLPGVLTLGLTPVQIALLATSALVSVLTVVPGRAKTLHAAVHLTLVAAFIFLSIVP